MTSETKVDRWYALLVRSRWESSTSSLLSDKGFRVFFPASRSVERARRSSKQTVAPLFPGYVFCQFDANNRLPILVTPGVLSIVGRGRNPLPVDDSEISALQLIVASGIKADPCPYLEVGQRIRIQAGALCGLEGILTSFRGSQRIVVSVSLLCRSVSLEIWRSDVAPILVERAAAAGRRKIFPVLEDVLA